MEARKPPSSAHRRKAPMREGLADAIAGAKGLAEELAESVARVLSSAEIDAGLQGGSTSGPIAELARCAARACGDAGCEPGPVGRGFVIGVARASRTSGEERLVTLYAAARCYVRDTAAGSGDVVSAARGVVEGAIAWATESGLDPTRAASAAGQGAVEGAREIGASAGAQARRALAGPIGGVTVVLMMPLDL